MSQVITWREKNGRQKRVETPGFHDRLTGADICKQFLSLRGYQERQVYLATVMRSYPLQVMDSGLIALFDGEKDYLRTSGKIEWLHRLAAYSNKARRAFDKLDERQQKIVLGVLVEKQPIEAAAKTLRITRKHCHNLFWQAVERLFPDYKNARPRPAIRHLRKVLDVLTDESDESGKSWRVKYGSEEDANRMGIEAGKLS